MPPKIELNCPQCGAHIKHGGVGVIRCGMCQTVVHGKVELPKGPVGRFFLHENDLPNYGPNPVPTGPQVWPGGVASALQS